MNKSIASRLMAVALSAGALFTSLPATSADEYRWIGDTLYVPMRSGKGNQFRIINKGLKTGTRLTLVNADSGDGWTEVRTNGGVTGFIPSHYLMDQPTAAQRLKSAETKLQTLQQEHRELQQRLGESQQDNQTNQSELQRTQQNAQQLQQELTEVRQISAAAIDLHQQHQQLMQDHQLLQTEMDVLKAENLRLQSDTRNTFFLYGAGAVLLGVLIAVIAPNLKPKKRYSEWAN